MQKFIGIGRITRDVELTKTPSDISVAKFTLAINRPYKDDKGNEQADFLPVIVWRTQAENCAKYLSKGKMCAVIGSIQNRNYEDKDGNKRNVTEIIAENVEFLSPKEDTEKAPSKEAKQTTLDDLKPLEDDSQLPF